jgi:hypothetical protein
MMKRKSSTKMAPPARTRERRLHSDHRKGMSAMSSIETIKQTELTPSEREVLTQDRARWRRMGEGGHLDDWLAYGPGLIIRRRLAMRIAFVNRPEGKGYAQAFGQLMNADGLDTMDKTSISAVLWLHDEAEHMNILREIREAMKPGERSRLNSPIAARQRVEKVLKARQGGTEDKLTTSPVSILKRQLADLGRELAHAQERLAAAENDGSRFDLRRDSVDAIVRVCTDSTVISETRATAIARGILATFKMRKAPAG